MGEEHFSRMSYVEEGVLILGVFSSEEGGFR